LKLLSFLKMKHNLQGIMTFFKFSYLLKNDKQKNMSCIWTTIIIYYNKLQKNCSKIHSYEKKIEKKDI
jgi:hypothetical protein